MNTTAVRAPHPDAIDCPKGCGAKITPRGMSRHFNTCPKNPDVRKVTDPLLGRIEREIAEAQSEADTHILKAVNITAESEIVDSTLTMEEQIDGVTAALKDAVTAMTRRNHYARLLENKE